MWSKRFQEWTQKDKAYLSVVFTWDLPQAYQRAVWLKQMGLDVLAGGPAVDLMPSYLSGVAKCLPYMHDVISRHNSQATFTSRGCVRRCPFCAVWRVEGELRELQDWPVRPIVCDNNLLACSRRHFDRVIDRLKPLSGIDFNQGLDARLLTAHHADRLAELDCLVRLAFDSVRYEASFMDAFHMLRKAGIAKSRIRAYVLIGFNDTPEDTLYRLRAVSGLGIEPSPMRYNPLDTLQRDSYVGPNWTDSELTRYTRYWANLRFFRAVPFEDFQKPLFVPQPEQMEFTT
jgi:hypothetical protein